MDTNQEKPKRTQHNSMLKIENLIQQGIIKARDIQYLTIRHDDSCALLARRGPCDCDPDVELWEELHKNRRKRTVAYIPNTGAPGGTFKTE